MFSKLIGDMLYSFMRVQDEHKIGIKSFSIKIDGVYLRVRIAGFNRELGESFDHEYRIINDDKRWDDIDLSHMIDHKEEVEDDSHDVV